MSRKVNCPSCGFNIHLWEEPELEQCVICDFCNAVLEVICLDPLELDWPIVRRVNQDDHHLKASPHHHDEN
jgi:lysine biosynthesis protein LysW